MHKLFLIATFLIYSVISAQSSIAHFSGQKELLKGIQAFNQEEYTLAKHYFSQQGNKDKSLQEFKQIHLLLCDLNLLTKGANLQVENFLKQNPDHAKKNTILLALGDYYFRYKKTASAQKVFSQVNTKQLPTDIEDELYFKLGFINLNNGNTAKAKEYLWPLKTHKQYKEQVNYYLGNIALQEKDYKKALAYFDVVKDNKSYKRELDFNRLIILYKTEQYQEAISWGKNLIKKTNKRERSEISKIIGESSFFIKNYREAITYLEQYQTRKPLASDYYFLGYAYYQEKQYDQAISQFNKIINDNSRVAQNAYYHLADCYLKVDKKNEALSAFKNASEMDFVPKIKEDALLNYAKLSYDVGNPFEPSTEVLKRYVTQYPHSGSTPKINSLIINAFLQFKDYKGVVEYYKKNLLVKDKIYQNALLRLGFTYFEDKDFKQAISAFDRASLLSYDKQIKSRAIFWKAETLFLQQKYKEAIYSYKEFLNLSDRTNEYVDGYYGIAYAYFSTKNYTSASAYFQKYIKTKGVDEQKRQNAILRLADCFFVQKTYWPALENYNTIIEAKHLQADYATYQKALCYGFLGRGEAKKEALLTLQGKYRKSAYLPQSYYQLGNLYLKQNASTKAIQPYDHLINKYPKNALVSKAMLKKGFIHFNNGKNTQAIGLFKEVVKRYPGTADAVQAVKSAEQVYKEMDNVEGYAAWVKKLEFINISDADIDNTMFSVAEEKYLEADYAGAITSLKKYLFNFENGLHSLTANFYLGQSYYLEDKKDLAKAPYQKVLSVNQNEYTEITLNRLIQILLEEENWETAFPLLNQLNDQAYNEQSQFFAKSNLMKYHYNQQHYPSTLQFVKEILENKQATDGITLDAYLYGARAAFNTENYTFSKNYYEKLETKAVGVIQAESLYYKAYFLQQDKQYEASNKIIQKLSAEYQQYQQWGIKGLVIMAQNYHELDDDFQANFILKNVIENAVEYPKIQKEAQDYLQTITVESSNVSEGGENISEEEF